ncbi:hypothetical protein [Mesorhizobium atlanticum]|uniref:hypothetical protein n=1 Tax=Mesorhizobium atlanticum TaxID=2233532 RepID=UPI001FDEEDEB|nr:hypothetical protein [Mesorhizobium atlanticum]
MDSLIDSMTSQKSANAFFEGSNLSGISSHLYEDRIARQREGRLDEHDRKEEQIETLFRNGTITVVGILLAFSLGFVTHWAANPVPWRFYDLFAVAPILVGIAFQMRALWRLLDVNSLRRQVYERANRIFIAGLILTACGVGLAILLDVLEVASTGTLPGA